MQEFTASLDPIESLKFTLCCSTLDKDFDNQKNVLDSVQEIIGESKLENVLGWMRSHNFGNTLWHKEFFLDKCEGNVDIFADALDICNFYIKNPINSVMPFEFMNSYPARALNGCCKLAKKHYVHQPIVKDDRPFEVLMQEFIDAL